MSIHEECGVFGIYDPNGGCARTAYYGLYALQHRGQESCGIVVNDDGRRRALPRSMTGSSPTTRT